MKRSVFFGVVLAAVVPGSSAQNLDALSPGQLQVDTDLNPHFSIVEPIQLGVGGSGRWLNMSSQSTDRNYLGAYTVRVDQSVALGGAVFVQGRSAWHYFDAAARQDGTSRVQEFLVDGMLSAGSTVGDPTITQTGNDGGRVTSQTIQVPGGPEFAGLFRASAMITFLGRAGSSQGGSFYRGANAQADVNFDTVGEDHHAVQAGYEIGYITMSRQRAMTFAGGIFGRLVSRRADIGGGASAQLRFSYVARSGLRATLQALMGLTGGDSQIDLVATGDASVINMAWETMIRGSVSIPIPHAPMVRIRANGQFRRVEDIASGNVPGASISLRSADTAVEGALSVIFIPGAR